MQNPFQIGTWRGLAGRHRGKLWLAQALAIFVLGAVLARGFFGSPGVPTPTEVLATTTASDSGPSMWTCSMHPQVRQPKPGKCPLCGMDLIPVTRTAGGLRTLTVSPESRALMSIGTAPVERRYATHEIRMVGKVDYDETKLAHITAWVSGRLDRLYADYTGMQVRKGDHMAYVYSPELYSAQEELIQAVKYRRDAPSSRLTPRIDLAESAKEKLRLLGLQEEQIREIEQQDRPTDHLTIYSPLGGIVIEKLKQEGDYVKTGERIYTVADLQQVWVRLDAYESDLTWIRFGQDVTISTEAYPGEEFHGRIAFIQPVLNDRTRTVKVRVNVPNADGKLKPEMFVRATLRPRVAAGGRVMDPSLAGKWISPMHPEIVKDEPGTCDICGMPLVRAESLGYVTPEANESKPPLLIPYSAALVTGARAVVYVELPSIHSQADPAFQTLSAVVQQGDLGRIRQAFATFGKMLDQPYDQPGNAYARTLWHGYADRLGREALGGQRARTLQEAEHALGRIELTMNLLREEFAPPGQPTFEGREIVLGPRAGDYYLVRNGVQEGELVVTQGNFKIDAEVQIQAKPSMMTPEGGGGGDRAHGGEQTEAGADEHAGRTATLPAEFAQQVRNLEDAYRQVAEALPTEDLRQITAAFAAFGQKLTEADGSLLTGQARRQWKELAMLLSNDAVEGTEADQMSEADRVFLLLKGRMRRLREQLGVTLEPKRPVEQLAVSAPFQTQLAEVWRQYLALQAALAADNYQQSREALPRMGLSLTGVDGSSLPDRASNTWTRERANLQKLIDRLGAAADITAMRETFSPLSQEIGVLAKAFGFGEAGPIYELHCPMAFQGQGATWYQDNNQVRNPYYGATMLQCADRVEQVVRDEMTSQPPQSSEQHSHN